MRSLADQVPVVTDLIISIAELLLGRRLLGAPRPFSQVHEPAVIDHVELPPATTAGVELKEGAVSLRVQLDESFWNERELANSSVTASLAVDGTREVTVWLEETGPRFRSSGLTPQEVEAVARLVGAP